jgi:DNA-binding transcriptional regulator YhcF (GntR family)
MIEIIGPLTHGALTRAGKPVPLQKQLIERLQQAILAGRLPAGALLPSSRLLAAELGVSRNTVIIAYDHLVAEGYVLADRRGTRVSPLSSAASHVDTHQDVVAAEIAYATRLKRFAATRSQSDMTSVMTPGSPALDRFPLGAWRRSLERAMERGLPQLLGYGEPVGEPALRDAIAAHLRMARGVRCDGSQVVITEGAQEALNLCESAHQSWRHRVGRRSGISGRQSRLQSGRFENRADARRSRRHGRAAGCMAGESAQADLHVARAPVSDRRGALRGATARPHCAGETHRRLVDRG